MTTLTNGSNREHVRKDGGLWCRLIRHEGVGAPWAGEGVLGFCCHQSGSRCREVKCCVIPKSNREKNCQNQRHKKYK